MVAIVYTTIDNIEDSRRIAYTLVEEQLVACVNIIPNIESFYNWKGEIHNDDEFLLLCKTTDENIKKTIERLKKLHSYELPAITVIPVTGGLQDYLDYIGNVTQ